jgi:hypothetical protein
VRVPDDAGIGVAKVTFSFDAWKEFKVKASTIELRVKKPDQGETSPEVRK